MLVCMHVCKHAYKHVCVCMCMYVCVCVCVCVFAKGQRGLKWNIYLRKLLWWELFM